MQMDAEPARIVDAVLERIAGVAHEQRQPQDVTPRTRSRAEADGATGAVVWEQLEAVMVAVEHRIDDAPLVARDGEWREVEV